MHVIVEPDGCILSDFVLVDVGYIGVICSEERLFLRSHGWSDSDCITATTRCTFQHREFCSVVCAVCVLCEFCIVIFIMYTHGILCTFVIRNMYGMVWCTSIYIAR